MAKDLTNFDCLDCDGDGTVELRIGKEFHEFEICPSCGGSGRLNAIAHAVQVNSWKHFNRALRDANQGGF